MVSGSHSFSDTLTLSAMGLLINKNEKECIDVSFQYKDRVIRLESIKSTEFAKTCIEHILRSLLFGIEGMSYLEDTSLILNFSKIDLSWRFDLLDGSHVVHSCVGSVPEFIDDLAKLTIFLELSPSALIFEIN